MLKIPNSATEVTNNPKKRNVREKSEVIEHT